MENDKQFFDWYKNKITDNAQDPPEDAWQNIADELDTNDVWDRVASELDHRGGWFGQKTLYYALPALLLLLISGGLYFYYNQNTNDPIASTTVGTYADADTSAGNGEVEYQDAPQAEPSPDQSAAASAEDRSRMNEAPVVEKEKIEGRASETIQSSNSKAQGSEAKVQGSRAKIQDSDETENSARGMTDSNGDLRRQQALQPSALQTQNGDSSDRVSRKANDSGSGVEDAGSEAGRSRIHVQDLNFAVERSEFEIQTTEPAVDSSTFATGSDKERDEPADQRGDYASNDVAGLIMPDSMLIVDPLALTVGRHSFETENRMPPTVFNRSFEFGISASAKNTWLLNQTTFMGLERHTLTTTLPDFGKDVGMVVRYNITPKLSAQAEGFLISDMGQRYNEYRKGKYIERDVDLNYFHGNLLVRYGNNATLLGRLVNGHGVIAGLYYSKLKNSTQTIDGETADISTLYSPSDYGIVLGYEYNQHLFSNFFFTTGVRLNYGLKNIRAHAGQKTGTGSFDVNFGLRYKLSF